MPRSKTLKLFLMDGEPSGRIKCSLANWTGIAYKIPRTALDKCKDLDILKQSGVYFLFGTDNAKIAIKEKLLSEFNLHTIIRMPHSVFAPYTSITTNILFFDRTHPTTETWFYRLDMPEGYKNFSKTKPMKLEHFAPAVEWWDNREEITIGGFDKAKKYSVEELKARNYNIDLCGYPHEEEEILPPKELILQYQEKRASLNADIDRILAQITDILGIDITEEATE